MIFRAIAFIVGATIFVLGSLAAGAQQVRINRLIEALERGEPAITSDVWTFVDQEHGPYVIDQLGVRLREMAEVKTSAGQQRACSYRSYPDRGRSERSMGHQAGAGARRDGDYRPAGRERGTGNKDHPGPSLPSATKHSIPLAFWTTQLRWGTADMGLSVMEYIEVADVWPLNPEGELFVMPMIENDEGVRNVGAILDVPGVGGVLIGPNDLSMGLGVGPWHTDGRVLHPPEAEAAIQTVAQACVAKEKHCGMVTWSDDETTKYIADGFQVIFATYRRAR